MKLTGDRMKVKGDRMKSELEKTGTTVPGRFARLGGLILGLTALMWFLLRVIPKPSRAAYPCQRAAFPVASAFVLWLCGSVAGIFSLAVLRQLVRRYRWAAVSLCAFTLVVTGRVAGALKRHSRSQDPHPLRLPAQATQCPAGRSPGRLCGPRGMGSRSEGGSLDWPYRIHH